MFLKDLHFKGYFQEQSGLTSESLQVVVPESEMEQSLLAWSILSHGETVEDDTARRDYIFHYELGPYLKDGLFVLKIIGRDASHVRHSAEIAAAMVATSSAEGRSMAFMPLWLCSDQLHFRPQKGDSLDRPAYGRLVFGAPDNLPHRRLFGVGVGT